MKRAVVGCIHGNLEALEAVLRDIDRRNDRGAGIGEIVCLGDVVGLGPNPRECLEIVRKRCGKVLAGEHETAVLSKILAPGKPIAPPEIRAGVVWAIQQIYGDDLRVREDDAYVRELIEKHRAPDYEDRLVRELAGKADNAGDLQLGIADRFLKGEGGPARRLFEKMLGHHAIRGLVLKFINRTRIQREAEEWIRWISALPRAHRADGARFVHDNPFAPGDGTPATPDRIFSEYDWSGLSVLFVGHTHVGGVWTDARRPGALLVNPGAVGAPGRDPTYALWTRDASPGRQIRIVTVPVGQKDATLRKMEAAGLS
ncbi:MAG TPA: metallophosphoesterase family protein [Planctomycetota bacterium]|nr:metallophosphoesterase family protein [Planctomycetota bacterium]